ncbi:MAG: hypothetical protein LBH82_01025 [Bacteroidales bacterium]|jgi:hypothetical protein|nr:hypothetical protein [Bacteroidales bacterium]
MNKRILGIGMGLLLLVCGCKDEKQKFREKASASIASYVEQNMQDFSIDSISILGIDSFTHLDYAYFRKVILKNHESNILSNELLYTEAQTEQDYEMQEKLQASLRKIHAQITECDNIMLNPTTDTLTVHYFFVATNIYGKQGDVPQHHSIGFPMDENFKIQEIDLGDN